MRRNGESKSRGWEYCNQVGNGIAAKESHNLSLWRRTDPACLPSLRHGTLSAYSAKFWRRSTVHGPPSTLGHPRPRWNHLVDNWPRGAWATYSLSLPDIPSASACYPRHAHVECWRYLSSGKTAVGSGSEATPCSQYGYPPCPFVPARSHRQPHEPRHMTMTRLHGRNNTVNSVFWDLELVPDPRSTTWFLFLRSGPVERLLLSLIG